MTSGAPVALELLAESAGEATATERFLREARGLASYCFRRPLVIDRFL
ncbi:hypothetical protein WME94_13895 [Sorangium sp. So ce429]